MSTPESRPVRAEAVVDLAAIRHNVTTLRARAEGAQLMAVVKADGYGHGMVPVARAAREAGADWIGAAVLEEALALRAAGDTGPIFCWLTTPGEPLADAIEAGIDLSAGAPWEIDELVAGVQDRPARVHLKIDTGMCRGGAVPEEWPALIRAAVRAQATGQIEIRGIWSHLASSDEPKSPVERVPAGNVHRGDRGRRVVRYRRRVQAPRELRRHAGAAGDPFRPGPAGRRDVRAVAVRACAAVGRARAAAGDDAEGAAGDGEAGAGRRGRLVRADLDRAAAVDARPDPARVRRRTAAARVERRPGPGRTAYGARSSAGSAWTSASSTSSDDQAAAGDEVVLFGPGTSGEPTADDWADAAGTINYEIVTRLGARIPRRYIDSER